MEQLNNLLKDLRLKYDQLESMKASALFIQDKHIIMSEQKGILFSMEQITKLIESMSSLPNITEYSAFNLFDAKYGRDLKTRFAKIEEEFFELKKEVEKISDNPDENLIIRIKDETCDLNACVGHFASILKLYQHEMLHYVVYKIKGREKDPNYKRFSVPDTLDVVVKYPTEFDKVENDFTIKRTTTQITGHPVAIPEKDYWIKPDPEFYYTEEMVIDAWKRVYESRETVKMVKCNQQGIQTENDNEHE